MARHEALARPLFLPERRDVEQARRDPTRLPALVTHDAIRPIERDII